jgi:hypothetical protein
MVQYFLGQVVTATTVARVNANNDTLINIFDASGHLSALVVMLKDNGSTVAAADLAPHFMLMPMMAATPARCSTRRGSF